MIPSLQKAEYLHQAGREQVLCQGRLLGRHQGLWVRLLETLKVEEMEIGQSLQMDKLLNHRSKYSIKVKCCAINNCFKTSHKNQH